jgi:MFS family permease
MSAMHKSSSWRETIRGNVLAMGLVSLFTDAASEMVYPLLPVFFSGLVPVGMAAFYVGLMEGVAESTASLVKFYSGRISDSLGRRKSLTVLGYGISTLCRPFMALSVAGWNVVALRFVDRIGKGIRTAPRDALISDSVSADHRGLAFSFHRLMDHAGAVLGPLMSIGILYLLLGYGLWKGSTDTASPQEMHALRLLFAISFLPGVAAMAALVIKVREIPPAPSASSETGPDASGKAHLPGRFYWFIASVTLFTLGNSSDLFLILYGKTMFGLGLLQVILLWVGLHVSKIVFSLPGGILSDRLGRRPVILTGWLVYTAVYVGMAFVTAQAHFWALMLVYGAYYGLTEGAEKALVADFIPSSQRGRAFGIYHAAVGIAALPASLLFGVFWAQLGPRLAFGIGAGLAAAATFMLIAILAARTEE